MNSINEGKEQEGKEKMLNILHFFILEDRGLPFFIRNYSESTFSDIDPLILSGFISAMETFAVTSMNSQVTDIGLKGLRLYLMHIEELIYVIAIKGSANNLSEDDYSRVTLILKKLRDAFKLMVDIFQLSGDFDKSKIINNDDLMASFGSTADNIILEGTKEFIETTEPEIDLKQFDEDSYLTDEYIGTLENFKSSEIENRIIDAFKVLFKDESDEGSEN
ncbi:MAG: hypothetical protein ACXAEU_25805 [Candidatus Hodarchaeales archaeon]